MLYLYIKLQGLKAPKTNTNPFVFTMTAILHSFVWFEIALLSSNNKAIYATFWHVPHIGFHPFMEASRARLTQRAVVDKAVSLRPDLRNTDKPNTERWKAAVRERKRERTKVHKKDTADKRIARPRRSGAVLVFAGPSSFQRIAANDKAPKNDACATAGRTHSRVLKVPKAINRWGVKSNKNILVSWSKNRLPTRAATPIEQNCFPCECRKERITSSAWRSRKTQPKKKTREPEK